MSNKLYKKFFLLSVVLLSPTKIFGRTTLTRNDYYPLYTTMDPQSFLLRRTKNILQGREIDNGRERDNFCFYLTPFGQNANVGRDFDNHNYPDCSCTDCGAAEDPGESHLGSLNARWSMIGLLMGDIPKNKKYGPYLQEARKELFGSSLLPTGTVPFCDSTAIDCEKKFGFFQFPGCYKKRGMRFQMEAAITDDIGIILEGGFSSINLNICMDCDNDLTPDEVTGCLSEAQEKYTNLTAPNVRKYLMCRLKEIAHELGRDLCDFHKTSIEDMRVGVYWRHPFQVNEDRDSSWAKFLFIPFGCLGFSLASGKEFCPRGPFSLPFGNNGHHAFWVYGGTNLDFTETIEVGWELGFTHFFDNTFSDYPMPTTNLQRGIFPFTTDVTVSPGMNWHFSLKMDAYHFLDRLSFYFQWVILEHKKDKFYARCCDYACSSESCDGCAPSGYCNNCEPYGNCTNTGPAFKPDVLTCRSAWKAQVINTALNYDISPNVSLGFAWQAPISQRNVFRSTTVAFGVNLTF